MVQTHRFRVKTKGNAEVLDLTPQLTSLLNKSDVRDGIATILVVGSTAGITTTEFEHGLDKHESKECFEKFAPPDSHYEHEATWGDDNGHSHVCASLLGPSITIPVIDGKLALGQWQQIVLIDFDTRSRDREIIL